MAKLFKQKDKCVLKENPKFKGEVIGVYPPNNNYEKEYMYLVQWVGYSQAFMYLGDVLITPEEANGQTKEKVESVVAAKEATTQT